MRDTPAPGKVIRVKAGEDASATIEKASCGDTVELQAGATFNRLVLPAKQCDDSHWIIIRTSTPDSKLPPEGTRLEPCYAGVASLPGRPPFHCKASENVLAKLEFDGKGGVGPVLIQKGANRYRLIGLEVTRVVSPAPVYHLIGPQNGPQGGAADHFIFDRMWIHGTPQNETVRGVMLSHIRYAAVIDSYLSDFHCVAVTGACVDSQAIAGGLGDDPMGPFKIVNNFLEAAAESILLGGGGATETPADIEIRGNHMFKPMIWMRGQPGFVGGLDGGNSRTQYAVCSRTISSKIRGGVHASWVRGLAYAEESGARPAQRLSDVPGHGRDNPQLHNQPCWRGVCDSQRPLRQWRSR